MAENDLWKDSRLKQLENIYKKQDYAETELQSRKKNQQTNQRQDSRKSTNQQLDGRRSSNQYQDGRRSSNQQQDIRRSSNQHVDRHKQANQQVDIRSYAARSQQQEKVTPNKTAQQRVTANESKSRVQQRTNETRKRKASEEVFSPRKHAVKLKKEKKGEDLHCVCRTPYNKYKKYVGCDLCQGWFHFECVGLNEHNSKDLDAWICDDCNSIMQNPEEQLYCICKTPYDDSRWYIGCDSCQDWFHGECIGLSKEDGDLMDTYVCEACKKKRNEKTAPLSGREKEHLWGVLQQLIDHKMAWPFRNPVDVKTAPNYLKVVRHPMDLSTVMKKLRFGKYKFLTDFHSDVSLIFNNCRQFNGPDTSVVKCAEVVETSFVSSMRKFRGTRS